MSLLSSSSERLTLSTLCDWNQAAVQPKSYHLIVKDIQDFRNCIKMNSKYEACELACIICAKITSFCNTIATLPIAHHDTYMKIIFPVDVLASMSIEHSVFDLSPLEFIIIGQCYNRVFNLVMNFGMDIRSSVMATTATFNV